MRFKDFYKFISESLHVDKLPLGSRKKIEERWDGGYELQIVESVTGMIKNPEVIHIIRETPKSIALAYQGVDNKISKYFWIPRYCCKIKKTGSGTNLEIPAYTNWFKDKENHDALNDFLNDFIEMLEQRDADKVDKLGEYVKDELDLILDQIGLDENIVSIKNKDKVIFEAITDKGKLIETRKYDPNSRLDGIKVYLDENSPRYSFKISILSKGKASFDFNINDKSYNRALFFSDINDDKYFNYLIKRCLGVATSSEEEGLLEFFEKSLKNHDWNYQMSDDKRVYQSGQNNFNMINDVRRLLSEFLSETKIDSIYKEFSSNK